MAIEDPNIPPEVATDPHIPEVTAAGDQNMQDLADALSTGLLPAPKTYRVIGPNRVHGTPPGDTFTLVLGSGQEAFLIDGGHVEIVVDEPPIQ
jgi:hypothetical protein